MALVIAPLVEISQSEVLIEPRSPPSPKVNTPCKVVLPVEIREPNWPRPVVWIVPLPALSEVEVIPALVMFPLASTLKLLLAAENDVPTVALDVVARVPKEPRPVVWIVPEPASRDVPVIPAKLAAPAEVI